MRNPTYQTRLGCDNCGHAQIRELPVRSIITNYDFDEHTPSSYSINSDGQERQERLIKCDFCLLPHLRVLWWKEEEVEVAHG